MLILFFGYCGVFYSSSSLKRSKILKIFTSIDARAHSIYDRYQVPCVHVRLVARAARDVTLFLIDKRHKKVTGELEENTDARLILLPYLQMHLYLDTGTINHIERQLIQKMNK